MKSQALIKEKFERTEKVLQLKPKLGQGTGFSTIRVIDGLSCEIKEGDWTLKTDMPTQVGGNASAPSPGVLGRAALGGCLASGYMMWASKLDIPIESLEIKIEADCDDGGLYGTRDVRPGYLEVRYYVNIKSPSPKETIEEFLNIADRHSPYLDVFSNAQSCVRMVEYTNT